MAEDIFIHEEIRNDELLKLMHEMRAERTPEKMLEVLKKAASSVFIVPVDVSGSGRISFHAVGDSNGRRFIVAYADTGSFITGSKSEDPKGVKSSFEDLMAAATEERLRLDGVIINPGAAEVILGRELLSQIKGQMSDPDTVDMLPAEPSEYPPMLKKMIGEFAKDEPGIRRVWVRLLVTPDGKTMRWLLGVESDLSGEERKYMLDKFSNFIKPYLQNVEPITADSGEDFVKQAVKDTEPFYERP